jgi:hypothetical protein
MLMLMVWLSGCGSGGSGSGGGGGFTIASGNWEIPLPGGATADGFLTQSGSTISGSLHVLGSPCFDPVADSLAVSGSASGDNFTLSFSTVPARGQVIAVNGSADPLATFNLNGPPRGPQPIFNGTASINGGACAGQMSMKAQRYDMTGSQIQIDLGTLAGTPAPIPFSGTATTAFTQTGPDASDFFHVTSSSWAITGSPCFTTGTITDSAVQGSRVNMTVSTDSGQLVGSGTFVQELEGGTSFSVKVGITFTVQGGTCNGETVVALVHVT